MEELARYAGMFIMFFAMVASAHIALTGWQQHKLWRVSFAVSLFALFAVNLGNMLSP